MKLFKERAELMAFIKQQNEMINNLRQVATQTPAVTQLIDSNNRILVKLTKLEKLIKEKQS